MPQFMWTKGYLSPKTSPVGWIQNRVFPGMVFRPFALGQTGEACFRLESYLVGNYLYPFYK